MTSIAIDRKDGLSSSTAIKGPCRVATTANIALNGLMVIDNVSVVQDDRVLVKDQSNPVENGIYSVDTGPWRRVKDFSRNDDVRRGTQVFITDGNIWGKSGWMVVSGNPVNIGTTSIVFVQYGLLNLTQLYDAIAEAEAFRNEAEQQRNAAQAAADAAAVDADRAEAAADIADIDARIIAAEAAIVALQAVIKPLGQLPSEDFLDVLMDASHVASGLMRDGRTAVSHLALPLLPYKDGGAIRALSETSSVPVTISAAEYDDILAIAPSSDVVDFIGKRGSVIERRSPALRIRSSIDNYATSILGVLVYGQSNSVAANSQVAYTTTALNPGRALMWDNGGPSKGPRTLIGDPFVPTVPHDNPNEVVKDSVYSSLIDLREANDTSWAETMTSRMCARYLLAGEPIGQAIVASVNGIDGLSYDQLKRGTVPYRNLLRSVMAGNVFARGLGLTYKVRWVNWIQGEANGADSVAIYVDHLVELADNLTADIQAITGQTESVFVMTDQVAQGPTAFGAVLAALEAAIAYPTKVICVGPKYQFSYNDAAHLTGASQALNGVYHGRAAKRTLIDGVTWAPVYPISAVRTGSTVVVNFNVPSGPLVLDTTLVSNPGNYGVSWVDNGDGNAVTVITVAISGAAQLTIGLSGTPTGTGQFLGFGLAGGNPGPTTGPRTNIRDSSADTETVNSILYHLYNWCCQRKIGVTV